MNASAPNPVTPSVRTRVALPLDLLLVVLFAIAGRLSHGEGLGITDLWNTAWPFLVGCMAGWQASRGWRNPGSMRTGIIVWLGSLVVGMILRVYLAEQTAAISFIIVAAIVLAVLLIGWRWVWAGIERRRPAASPAPARNPQQQRNPQQKRASHPSQTGTSQTGSSQTRSSQTGKRKR